MPGKQHNTTHALKGRWNRLLNDPRPPYKYGRLTISIVVTGLIAALTPILAPNILNWSWAQVLFFIWLGSALYFWSVRPGFLRCPRYWFSSIGGLFGVLCATVILAMIPWNNGQLLGLPLANTLNDWLAFAPFQYDHSNINWAVWGNAIARAVILLILGLIALEYHYRKLPYDKIIPGRNPTPKSPRHCPSEERDDDN